MTRSIAIKLLALAALAGSASAGTGTIDLNGGSSWGGWNYVGNSQTSGLWVKGATNRTYDIYSTSFVLSASQTASGTGNDTASLFSGSWQAGDRIIGMGIQYTGSSRGNQFFFHTDTGAVNIQAASSFGATNGVYTADSGDTSSHMFANHPSGAGKVRQYSVFDGFTSNGGSNYDIPYGIGWAPTPVRSFTVADAGTGFYSTRVQFLMNIDAILRSNGGATFGEGSFGSTLRVGFQEQDLSGGWSQQVFTVAPTALLSSFCFCQPTLGPCGNDDPSGGCANSTGAGARLSPSGTTSVAADNLILSANQLPPNRFLFLIMSSGTREPMPMRDGLSCLMGSISRFAPLNSGLGAIQYGPGLAAYSANQHGANAIAPGSEFGFQIWYRDSTGPCGLGSNLTNAVRALFIP
jgi:hypothetical protein